VQEFRQLRKLTKKLVAGAVEIPAMAMRPGKSALIPLLRYLPALTELIRQGDLSTGTFAPFMDGPQFQVKNPWFRSWLDALAFSLSGLPAARTSAAAMAYVLYDMHRPDAALDYPKGGLGRVIDALVKGVEQGSNGSKVNLRRHVESIDTSSNGSRITGLTLRGGKKIMAREGVIHNAPVWSLNKLIKNPHAQIMLNNFLPQHSQRKPRSSWKVTETGAYVLNDRESFDAEDSLLFRTDTAEMTGSFLHLHLAIKADGLDLDKMEAHYTVMDRSLAGSGPEDGPCGELNMIAVSNPCMIDQTLAPEGYIIIHAYGAGNEPYELWKDVKRNSPEYKRLKEERAEVLWRAVESIIPNVKKRVVLELIGSPRTHERFLRRPNGTYGSATEDYLKDGSTPYKSLVLAGDGIFPGIGIPAVALNGASAANAFVSPLQQWLCLDQLQRTGII
jgi:phytoene dehydrogenase-like protein